MSDQKIRVGINLNDRTIYYNGEGIPTISAQKVILKTDKGNYLREENNAVIMKYGTQTTDVSTAVFTNHSLTLPEDFGVVTEIDESAVTYEFFSRTSHEKKYVTTEDMERRESLDKSDLLAFVEDKVKSYGMPTNSIIGYDGDTIPDGFEEWSKGNNLRKVWSSDTDFPFYPNSASISENADNFKMFLLRFQKDNIALTYIITPPDSQIDADGEFSGWTYPSPIDVSIDSLYFKAILAAPRHITINENSTGYILKAIYGFEDTDQKVLSEVATLSNKVDDLEDLIGDLGDALDEINGEVV